MAISGSRAVRPATRILIVEDNPGEVALLRWAIERAGVGCALTIIEDGADARAFVHGQGKHAHLFVPDLTILDLNLPRHSGLEVLQAIRASRALAELPVAILSSSSSPGDRVKLDELGITAYIEKPSDLKSFLDIGFIVKNLLESNSKLRLMGHS